MMLLGGLQWLSASYGKGSQNSTAKDTANKESTVSAGRTVSIESGKDTDIIGSHDESKTATGSLLSGDTVKGKDIEAKKIKELQDVR